MSDQQARPGGTRPGIDHHQARARAAAGYGIPMVRDKATPATGPGVVALVCEHCGCTYGKAADAKSAPCTFCGKEPKPVFGLRDWTRPTDRVLNDRKAGGGDS